ncbi:ABC transporter permease [Fulvivirgaceae bacterium BMA12]|uniref:ABC transporter permease n=1 Tax=Agaribacillus aureus TaxID=3051825 RepID=A0ABT8L1Y2_9BACT|nr:ABC transporter permease [Fulvivirgaceae bacterium BMA12]
MANKNQLKPPNCFLRFFRWYCHPDYQEDIEGDLLERFENRVQESGVSKAKWLFIKDVLLLFRPGILAKFSITYINKGMLRNFMTVSFRNLLRNKTYATINVTGLSLALGIAIALFSIVRFEKSFDTYHKNADRLFQIVQYSEGSSGSNSHTPYGAIYALREEIPEVEFAGAILKDDPQVIEVENQKLKQPHTYFIEPDILKMLDVDWIYGSPETSLSGPYQAVLDVETAERLFGDLKKESALGKVISYDNKYDMKVSGIVQKSPTNSEFQFKMLLSMATRRQDPKWYETSANWEGGHSWHHGYVQLKEGVRKEVVEEKLNKIYAVQDQYHHRKSFGFVDLKYAHFNQYNDSYNYDTPAWLLGTLTYVGLFLILIACINFINLATIQATHRYKEIAIRKVMGSSRNFLIGQFMIETGLIVAVSMPLAVLLAQIIINASDRLLTTQIAHVSIWDVNFFLFLLGSGIAITLLAGFYPAFIFSRFRPIRILRSKLSTLSSRKVTLRHVMVISQFVIAQTLVIIIIVSTKQMRHFYSADLGFNQEAIVTVNMPEKGNKEKRERLRSQLLRHPEILEVTFGLTAPATRTDQWWSGIKHPGAPEDFGCRIQFVDNNYLDFYGLELIAGRGFLPSDTGRHTIVNELAVREMGFTNAEEALGEVIEGWPGRLSIIGVIKDFHSQSLKDDIVAHAYLNNSWNFKTASIKLSPHNMQKGMEHIEAYWSQLFPKNYFEFQFLSEDLKRFYESERKFSNFLGLFAIAGILIGIMGLYGLINFVCISKTKEIGIRKVLGSTLTGIVVTLSGGFFKLVLIAFIFASALGWYLMDSFLQNYAYRITVGWEIFALAALISVGVASIPISSQAVKAAVRNPVDALRNE